MIRTISPRRSSLPQAAHFQGRVSFSRMTVDRPRAWGSSCIGGTLCDALLPSGEAIAEAFLALLSACPDVLVFALGRVCARPPLWKPRVTRPGRRMSLSSAPVGTIGLSRQGTVETRWRDGGANATAHRV